MLIVSINLKKNVCQNCSAPLGPATSSFLRCAYCDSEFYAPPLAGFRIPQPRVYPHLEGVGLVEVGSHTYRVHGRLARGLHGDVFLGRRERALTEMVLIKVAHRDGASGLRREWDTIGRVRACHEFLAHLLAVPIVLEMGHCHRSKRRLTAVYRWRSGFSFTALDAHDQYPRGVSPRAVVWIWNRVLDTLACLHESRYSHNAIALEHLLLHPRDHGVALCGWSEASLGQGEDLASSGACMATLLGRGAPRELRDLARQAGHYTSVDDLKKELKTVAGRLFGPPRFHEFTLH